MTEDKIKEAFEAWVYENSGGYCADRQYREHHELFEAGYLACMNGLEYAATLPDNGTERVAYFLPKGVTKP